MKDYFVLWSRCDFWRLILPHWKFIIFFTRPNMGDKYRHERGIPGRTLFMVKAIENNQYFIKPFHNLYGSEKLDFENVV